MGPSRSHYDRPAGPPTPAGWDPFCQPGQRSLELKPKNPMKTANNTVTEDHPAAPSAASLRIKLALLVGWGILTFLLAMGLAVQPVQAQKLGDPLPDSITITRSVVRGKKAITFHVNAPHSLFRYYDRVGNPYDSSGGNCYKNRVWFEYYMADHYDDTEPIRQSHDYTLRQRGEGFKVCILVVFGDWRGGGAGGNPNGPFSFDPDQTIVVAPPEEKTEPEKKKVEETKKTGERQPPVEDKRTEERQPPVGDKQAEEQQSPVEDKQPKKQPPPESKKPLPAQAKEDQQPAKAPRPEPEPASLLAPAPAPELTDPASEAGTETANQSEPTPPTGPEAPEAEDQQDPLPLEIEASSATEPSPQPEKSEAGSDTASNLIWLGAYILAVLAIGTALLVTTGRRAKARQDHR